MSHERERAAEARDSHRNFARTRALSQRAEEFSETQGLSFGEYLQHLVDYKGTLLAIFLLCTAAGGFLAYSFDPAYVADATVRMRESTVRVDALRPVVADYYQQPILTAMEMLKSRSTLSRAVARLGLGTTQQVRGRLPWIGEWLAQRLPRDDQGLVIGPLSLGGIAWGGEKLMINRFDVSESDLGVGFLLTVGDAQTWTLTGAGGAVLLTGRAGQIAESKNGELVLDIAEIRARPGTQFSIAHHSPDTRAMTLVRGLGVSELSRNSGVIKLQYSDQNARVARDTVNAIADAFVQADIDDRKRAADLSIKFLDQQLPEVKARLQAAEDRMNEFRVRRGSIDLSSEAGALVAASTELAKRRAELDMQKRELALRLMPEHPQMQLMQRRIEALDAETKRLGGVITKMPNEQQAFLRLKSDVEVQAGLYTSLLKSAQELRVARAGTIGGVVVLDYALTPTKPTVPVTRILGGAALIGLLLGVLCAFLVALVLRRVRDPMRLEEVSGASVAAVLPFISQQSHRKRGESYLHAAVNPGDFATEALRGLRTQIRLSMSAPGARRVVLVTSALPGQGKSFVASNLGFLLASAGSRVLIIDADMRRPALHRYVGERHKSNHGLTELLGTQDGSLELIERCKGLLQTTDYPNLSVLPAGRPSHEPSELLSSPRMGIILDWAVTAYDIVIVDSPPVLPTTDAELLVGLCGEVLYVMRHQQVSEGDVIEGLGRLSRAMSGASVSIVYNCFKPLITHIGSHRSYGYYRYYRYGYQYGYKPIESTGERVKRGSSPPKDSRG